MTPDPFDAVIGVDFSGGMSAIVAQLNAALGPAALQFSNPSGSVLRVLDDGAGGLVEALTGVGALRDDDADERSRRFGDDGAAPLVGTDGLGDSQ